jgi:hypothetical protein
MNATNQINMSEAEIEDMEILEARLDCLYDNIEDEIG